MNEPATRPEWPITIVVPFVATKSTSQIVTSSGGVIPSKKTRRCTDDLAMLAREGMGRWLSMLREPVRVDVLVRIAVPKTGPHAGAKPGDFCMADRYDRSNVAKFVDDALQDVIYPRDGVVVTGVVERRWGYVDSMTITVGPATGAT